MTTIKDLEWTSLVAYARGAGATSFAQATAWATNATQWYSTPHELFQEIDRLAERGAGGDQ